MARAIILSLALTAPPARESLPVTKSVSRISAAATHPPRVAAMLLAEVFIVVILSSTLAAAMTLVTWRYGPSVIESFVLA